MNIFIAGLGLIGASFSKAIKQKTPHKVFGMDINAETVEKALLCGAVDFAATEVETEKLQECDLVIVALNFDKAIAFVEKNAENIKKGAVVLDICGVKRAVCETLENIAHKYDFIFLGGHPMAGREVSGFENSLPTLFSGASMLLAPFSGKAIRAAEKLFPLFELLGFARSIITTPEEHDKIIAYTSQLAHIASNAYIKSPTAEKHRGFSAGSFRDLTRVAYLDEDMWSDLFLANADNLSSELDFYIEKLCEYREALKNKDREQLKLLLKDGKERKIKSL